MRTASRKAPHIALFLPNLAGGGAERVALNLMEGLEAMGCQVDIVLASEVGEYSSQIPQKGVRVVDLACSRALYAPVPLARYLRQARPDVLIGSMGHINLAALAARLLSGTGTKIIVTEHLAVAPKAENLTDWVYRFLARKAYPHSEAVVAVSQGVAKSLAVGLRLPLRDIHVILNPVLTKEYWRKVREPVVHPWFEPNEPPVILGAGRLAAQKDFPTLIAAFSKLRETINARLIILGEGPDRKKLEGLVSGAGLAEYVAFPGFVENPLSFMSAAALFTLSSVREGLPTVLIEALVSGTPVVSTDCESGPREILQGGRLGRLVPVGDVDALARAMISGLASPKSAIESSDWEMFTPAAAARQYLAAANLEV